MPNDQKIKSQKHSNKRFSLALFAGLFILILILVPIYTSAKSSPSAMRRTSTSVQTNAQKKILETNARRAANSKSRPAVPKSKTVIPAKKATGTVSSATAKAVSTTKVAK